MSQNPATAIMHLGHGNGTVTLWSPNMTTPLVKMQCHRGPVTALAIDHAGTYMATAGLDGQLKLWDLRSYKPVQEYYTPTPAASLSISQRGLLGVGFGPHVSIWKDPFRTKQTSPYMNHLQPGSAVQDVRFVPFEDVLGFGHRNGFGSIIVPGAGEPNFDALEANPFQTKKQRQEMEVHSLLEKIQPEMITLDVGMVGKMDKAPIQLINKEKKEAWAAANPVEAKELKFRARGKNSSSRRHLRKQAKNVIDQKKVMDHVFYFNYHQRYWTVWDFCPQSVNLSLSPFIYRSISSKESKRTRRSVPRGEWATRTSLPQHWIASVARNGRWSKKKTSHTLVPCLSVFISLPCSIFYHHPHLHFNKSIELASQTHRK